MAARVPGESRRPAPKTVPFTVQLAPMRRKHLRSVMRIESEVYSHPWTTSLFMSELALRNNRAYTVAQVGSLVVGYSGLMFIGDDAHVTTIAVDPLWHRHKVATRLMLHNVRLALQHNAKHITLEVRMSNEDAQNLYRKFGFAPAGVRKNYYSEVNEDALIMWANDIDSESYTMRMSAIEAGVPGATIAEVP
jgi:[ribosomal protein S18]-alanine N-acetyltransferase